MTRGIEEIAIIRVLYRQAVGIKLEPVSGVCSNDVSHDKVCASAGCYQVILLVIVDIQDIQRGWNC